MQLNVLETTDDRLRAGYACPCGCEPSVEYVRGAEVVEEGCCCGNDFAVGPDATRTLAPKPGYRAEQVAFDAPWGESLQAAWSVGPSVHGPDIDHEHESEQSREAEPHNHAVDPVCGMTVDPDGARAKGLHSSLDGTDYFFCGKGCKLEFDEDPNRYLDPAYVPSM